MFIFVFVVEIPFIKDSMGLFRDIPKDCKNQIFYCYINSVYYINYS